MGEKRFWAGDDEGNLYYLVTVPGDGLLVYGSLPRLITHMPELILIIYAIVAFPLIWVGFAGLAILVIAAVIPLMLIAVILPRIVIVRRGIRFKALIQRASRFKGKLAMLTLETNDGELVLYANVKHLPTSIAGLLPSRDP